jgi:hypothetical protein
MLDFSVDTRRPAIERLRHRCLCFNVLDDEDRRVQLERNFTESRSFDASH